MTEREIEKWNNYEDVALSRLNLLRYDHSLFLSFFEDNQRTENKLRVTKLTNTIQSFSLKLRHDDFESTFSNRFV